MKNLSTTLVALALFLTVSSTRAQVITDVNVGAGISHSMLSPGTFNLGTYPYEPPPYIPGIGFNPIGFELNAVVVVRGDSASDFGLQTGASMCVNTLSAEHILGADEDVNGPEWSMGYLDIPLLLHYDVQEGDLRVSIAAGAYVGLNLFTNSDVEDDPIAKQVAAVDYGTSFAVGFEHAIGGTRVLWLTKFTYGAANMYTGEDTPEWFQDRIDECGGVTRSGLAVSCNVRL